MDILETVLLGVGTVFVGLICLIGIIELMHALVTRFAPPEKEIPKPAAPIVSAEPEIDHNTLVVLAATAIAENLGKDVNAIRIKSIRKI